MNASLYTLGFLMAVAYCPGILDYATAPRWAVAAVGVPLFLLVYRRAVPSLRPVVASAAIIPPFAAAFSIVLALDRLTAFDDLLHLCILAGAFVLGARVKDLTSLWAGIGSGVAIAVIIAVPQVLGLDVPFVPQAVPPSAFYGNKNVFGEACLVALITAPMTWMAVVAFIGMAISTSKAVWGAALLVLALKHYKQNKLNGSLMVGALVLATVAAFVLGMPSAVQRFGYWTDAAENLTSFGWGLGSFVLFRPDAEFAHSEPVQLAFELGLLALPALATFIYAMGGRNERYEREWLVLTAIAAVGLLAFPLHIPLTGFAAAVAAGRLVDARVPVRRSELDRSSPLGVGGQW